MGLWNYDGEFRYLRVVDIQIIAMLVKSDQEGFIIDVPDIQKKSKAKGGNPKRNIRKLGTHELRPMTIVGIEEPDFEEIVCDSQVMVEIGCPMKISYEQKKDHL